MKLVHPELEFSIDFSEGSITSIFFDSPSLLRKFLFGFLNQYENDEGSFVLSEDGDEISLQNNVSFITDSLCFDINDKRLTNKIQSQLKAYAISEEMYEYTVEMLAHLDRYSERIKETFIYPVANKESEAASLIKMLNFTIDFDYENELEKLLEYMNMMHDICGVKAFVVLNLFHLFSIEEIKVFCENIKLHGHSLLLINSGSLISDQPMEFLRKIIIDSDGCQIF